MRLTLRTLLAYLDNTLDPQDAEDLKTKLSESGFATQLVQRIRAVLENGSLGAPSPDAVAPVDDANTIGEYLDSTLPVEQVAEIERACLESDPHLAEAAACHQILTIVLKQPAEIPAALRERILALPDRGLDEIAAGGSFSGVTIPPDSLDVNPLGANQLDVNHLGAEPPTSQSSLVQESGAVRPVGPDDSGVSDAPTRLRDVEASLPQEAGGTAMAGARPRNLDQDTRLYGGAIRPSRITPWLVSLGLAAVLLFVLGQLFRPLYQPKLAEKESESVSDVEPLSPESTTTGESATGQDRQAEAVEQTAADRDADAAEPAEPQARAVAEEDAADDSEIADSDPAKRAESSDTADEAKPTEELAESGMPTEGSEQASEKEPMQGSESVADEDTKAIADAAVPAPPQPKPPELVDEGDRSAETPSDELGDQDGSAVATLISGDGLVVADVADQWVRLKQDAKIVPGVPLFAAPTFRDRLAITGGQITLVGPCELGWIPSSQDQATLFLIAGKLLIEAQQADLVLPLRLGQETLQLRFQEPETKVALAIDYFRAPGLDPLEPGNRIPVTSLVLVQGSLTAESKRGVEEIAAGKERIVRGVAEPAWGELDAAPGWIDPVDSPLNASARSGLLELLDGSQPIELQLREATLFRRSEVAALAGRTLLGMGQADVYFGGDGLFNEAKQRAFWPDHYSAVLAAVDRSAETAEELHDSIVRMDSANAGSLLRLLTGFTQEQLEQGADQELVELLDSPSMAVRVFALENLQRITGTTLYFRPDQDNPVRRAPIIKKWETRLRKGDIRWPQS